MADWSLLDREWLPGLAPAPEPYDPYQYADFDPYYHHKGQNPQLPPPAQVQPPQAYFSPPSPTLTMLLASPQNLPPPVAMPLMPPPPPPPLPRGDNPREIRNKAEKQRRDTLNHSIAELASMVPPVVAASRKIDKTGVLRLSAHYLRAHQYVFGDSVKHPAEFTPSSTNALLSLLNGFLLTLTYKGLVVVVSQNVSEYLGYTELDLLGHNIFNLIHEDDHRALRDQLMPRTQKFGKNGELLLPEELEGRLKVAQALANEKRRFIVRFKKLGQRSEAAKYVSCHVEGSLRKSDRACRTNNRCCPIVRRTRARGENPCSSGNDVVFIGVVRPTTETFMNEIALESYKMEYRTRHSIDGGIIQCEQRISLVTGYMTHEVKGVNAMNFIHRDEVRWVIVSLREMYIHHRLYGESSYRLMTKNGQFVYMRTRGRLDVDSRTGAVTSFVCTNTVVDEVEGKHSIQLMKEKFATKQEHEDMLTVDEDKGASDPSVPVEDPRQLEKVILHLVDNLPSQDALPSPTEAPASPRLSLIPPRKDRILSAIEKIYTVIKSIPKFPSFLRYTLTPPLPADDFLRPDKLPPLPYDNTYLQGDMIYNPSPPAPEQPTYPIPQMVNQFQMIPPQDFQEQLFPIPGPSGTKRSNFFEEDEMAAKKKVNELGLLEPEPVNSPSLESFFDEAILDSEIESAIDSLEHTIDPNFPDLLVSNEVQEILGMIEGTHEDII